MADGKKTVIIYCDWIKTFEALDDDEAGRLAKHLFRYINDQDPIAPDKITKIAFTPIKQTLKRDLKKWESEIEQKSINGIIGNLKRWNIDLYNKYISKELSLTDAQSIADSRTRSHPIAPVSHQIAKIAVSDSVIVSDSEEEENKKEYVFNFRKSLINLRIEANTVEQWMKVRKAKKAVNTEIAFKKIKLEIEKCNLAANDCIKKSIEKSWAGFEANWIDNTLGQNRIDKTGLAD